MLTDQLAPAVDDSPSLPRALTSTAEATPRLAAITPEEPQLPCISVRDHGAKDGYERRRAKH